MKRLFSIFYWDLLECVYVMIIGIIAFLINPDYWFLTTLFILLGIGVIRIYLAIKKIKNKQLAF